MKRREKSGNAAAEKLEILGGKLKRVGKRAGHTTPVAPFWRIQQQLQLRQRYNNTTNSPTSILSHHHCQSGAGFEGGEKENCRFEVRPFEFRAISARKLAATLWELHHHQHHKLPFSRMNHGKGFPPPSRIRRLPYHHHYEGKADLQHPDPSPSSPNLPGSASSLRRQVALLMQHHRPVERSNRALQPASPASYGSSLEVTPYNPAVTPSGSIDYKGRVGEPDYSLKTSTELLKVLNRIWSLEEKHAANVLLVRSLKKELDHARVRIKDLVREQQADRHERDELMKQIAEDKLARKSKEQDRINGAILSAREELEDERKLRKRSESLHRKLAWELYEMKTAFATNKELENERKLQLLLEDLCDEFAWGIRDFDQELHALRQKQMYDKEWAGGASHDRLILHMCDAWLDERMQMKLEPQLNLKGKTSVVDKLSSEIEAFLQAKRNIKCNSHNQLPARDFQLNKNHLESTPLNIAVSTLQHEDDEENSAGSDSHCFELQKESAVDLMSKEYIVEENLNDNRMKQKQTKKKLSSDDKLKSVSPASLQVKFEEQMAQSVSQSERKDLFDDADKGKPHEGNPVEISISKNSETHEAIEEGSLVRRIREDGTPGLNSNNMIDNLIRSRYLLSESMSTHPETDMGSAAGGTSVWRNLASPVREWTERLPPQELEITESSSKLPSDLKDNSLKAKLIEARTRSQRSRSCLKGSKIK